MSDAAFANHPYPSYTTTQLAAFVKDNAGNTIMAGELIRRNFRAMHDTSIMSAGERMNFVRNKR